LSGSDLTAECFKFEQRNCVYKCACCCDLLMLPTCNYELDECCVQEIVPTSSLLTCPRFSPSHRPPTPSSMASSSHRTLPAGQP
jgi:hypothetical protein